MCSCSSGVGRGAGLCGLWSEHGRECRVHPPADVKVVLYKRCGLQQKLAIQCPGRLGGKRVEVFKELRVINISLSYGIYHVQPEPAQSSFKHYFLPFSWLKHVQCQSNQPPFPDSFKLKYQILPPSTISLPINSSSPLSAVRLRSNTHRPSPASSCSRTYVTLSAALPFRECAPLQPLPLGVMGEVAEMGDAKPADWRRGPLEVVAAGDERVVSMGGGDAGC